MGKRGIRALAATVALACALAAACLASPRCAFADTSVTPEVSSISLLQQKVEESAQAYNDAAANVERLQGQRTENQAKIADIEANLSQQQQRCGAAMKTLYIMQNEGYSLANMLLDSGSLNEFLQRYEYLECLKDSSSSEIEKYAQMKSDSETLQTQLDSDEQEAEAKAAAAADALAQAKAERQAAADAAAAETPELSAVDWTLDRTAFVEQWTARIDAYLTGSPLAGQGKTFAEAAWDYGVDPRWSPAISNTESSKGRYLAGAYNAWGWKASETDWRSFGSWTDAIQQHVAYLARAYGYTITKAHAAKYCPPGDTWYASTIGEMAKI